MAWFADLAGKAENLLNNLDEQTGVALRNHNVVKSKKHDYVFNQELTVAGQKKRPTARNFKKVSTGTDTRISRSNFVPTRKSSPTSHLARSPTKESQDLVNRTPRKKSPTRKSNTHYSLNHCPKTLVGDIRDSDIDEHFGIKQRRYSLPADLELLSSHNLTYKMQNLEVENAMLKNELNVMNREVSDLLDRLRKTEDGNTVVNGCSEELRKTQIKLENGEMQNQRLMLERDSQGTQLEQLKHKIHELTNIEVAKHKEHNQALQTEVCLLKDRNLELEDKISELKQKSNENNSAQIKLENELRHAQSVISDLNANLEKSTEECRRLEKDWEAYKVRVKSMLFAKDDEIKSLQEGLNLTEDTKALVEQIDALKEERELLTETLNANRRSAAEDKQHASQLEARLAAAERVVAALRDALKDERIAKNRVEGTCSAISKELRKLEFESGQTIDSLTTALRDKETEINQLRCTASSIRSTDTSALNVADYDVQQQQQDHEKIQHLTDALVQRQGRLDALLQDNNVLRIQLDKLQSKYKAELASKRTNHSVVHVDADRARPRPAPASALSALSVRVGVAMKRHPLFRSFVVMYMVCLHFWVLTVLFTSTPDGHIPLHVKS